MVETQELIDTRQKQRGGAELVEEIRRQTNDVLTLNFISSRPSSVCCFHMSLSNVSFYIENN